MNIRPYQNADWPRLCAIHDLARMDELREAGLQDAFIPLEIAAEKEGLFDYDILVAERNGTVLGFVAFSEDELAWLYVDPGSYRSGVGKLLTKATLLERPNGLSIEVLSGNEAALAFYKSVGFVESGITNGRMPGNEKFHVTVHCLTYARST